MIKICVNNGKGGVGKTTTVCSLAGILASNHKKKVLVLDTDTQCNASIMFGFYESDNLAKVFEGSKNINDIVEKTKFENIDLIPGSFRLSAIGADIKGQRQAREILANRLSGLDGYDYCLIDTPPSLDLIPQNAMVASDYVLMPLEASKYSIYGLAETKKTIDEIAESIKPIKILGMFLNRVDTRTTLSHSIKDYIASQWGDLVMDTYIRNNVALAEAINAGKPINVYDPRSNGSKDFSSLTDEIRNRLRRYASGN